MSSSLAQAEGAPPAPLLDEDDEDDVDALAVVVDTVDATVVVVDNVNVAPPSPPRAASRLDRPPQASAERASATRTSRC